MPLKKRYISKGTVCKVTFILPDKIDADEEVTVVGDFNGWDEQATPMNQLKSGAWKARVKIDADSQAQYRYLVDGAEWVNDTDADRYVPNPYGTENSVVMT